MFFSVFSRKLRFGTFVILPCPCSHLVYICQQEVVSMAVWILVVFLLRQCHGMALSQPMPNLPTGARSTLTWKMTWKLTRWKLQNHCPILLLTFLALSPSLGENALTLLQTRLIQPLNYLLLASTTATPGNPFAFWALNQFTFQFSCPWNSRTKPYSRYSNNTEITSLANFAAEEGYTHIERGVRVTELIKITRDIPKTICSLALKGVLNI